MYPFGSLPDNLVAFGGVLRREYGFRIGPGELAEAARALDVVELADEIAVRHALRPVLSRTPDDAAVFDQAFTRFFFPGPTGVPQLGLPPEHRALPDGTDDAEGGVEPRGTGRGDAHVEDRAGPAGRPLVPADSADLDDEAPVRVARASYSPLEADAVGPGPELRPADRAWRDAARLLVRRLHLGLSRRWRPAVAGRRFDTRRTLRASLQTGGEPLDARWLARPRRTPRFVVLVDGSRSMDAYATTALEVAVAIASVTMRIEVFTFSTSLQRVTDEVRRAAAGATRRLEDLHRAWGGGTSIGACLREFLQRAGGRYVRRDTVVIVASDGLDVGAPDVLRESMRELHRRSAGVIWLNPLSETPGYEPTASGMSAARPFITTLASVSTPADLARLATVVRVRA